MMRRHLAQVILAVAALLLVSACDRPPATEIRGHRITRSELGAVQLNVTTAAEVEGRFGEPDDRAADGALTYRYSTVRHQYRQLAGWTLPLSAGEKVTEHTVTFRFENGILHRICQTRS